MDDAGGADAGAAAVEGLLGLTVQLLGFVAAEQLGDSSGNPGSMGPVEQVMGEAVGEGDGASQIWMLWVAAAAVLASALALAGGIVLHFVGYALASLLAFTLIAMFRRRSVERSATVGIGVPHWINVAAAAVLVIGFLVSLGHSWFIASYFS